MESPSYKISKTSLSDRVFKQIKALVLSGEWKTNEKIPSEQALSQMFGVSRLTVRIALEKLNALHILDTRVGDGTYVCKFDFQSYIAEIDELMLFNPDIINDVRAYRTAIELCAVEQLIKGEPDIPYDELMALCEEMESLSIPSAAPLDAPDTAAIISHYVDLDYNFHCKLCEYSGNQLLYYSYLIARSPITCYLELIVKKRIREYIRDHPGCESVPFERFYGASLSQELHKSILQSIRDRDYDLCQLIHKYMHNYTIDSADIASLKQR